MPPDAILSNAIIRSENRAETGIGQPGSVPRTLLLSGTPPGPDGVGGIILQDLCNRFPAGSLCAYLLLPDGPPPPLPAALRDLPVATGPDLRQPRATSHFGAAGRLLAALSRQRMSRHNLGQLTAAAVTFGRHHAVERVWAVLDSPAAIRLAAPVAAGLGVPLYTTVWDDVQHNLDYFGLDRLERRTVVAAFERALAASRHCAVIGEAMRDTYRARYGIPATIVRHGLEPGLCRPPRMQLRDTPELRIGFAGSVSARSAFDALTAALDRLGWSLTGRPVVLRLMGPRFDLRSRVARRIECLGWRSVDETVALLGECDINYLPQPFEPSWETFTRLSFPSKLTTYLGAGVPLLLHTPAYGSLSPFFDRYPFGVRCHTLDAAALSDALQQLAGDTACYRSAAAALGNALAEQFTADRFLGSFAAFFGVDARALA